jgi:hypothetical protein
MTLALARENVRRKMKVSPETHFRNTDLVEAIWIWWNLFMQWEGQDTFLQAFTQKRLCITQRPQHQKYDMKAKRSKKASSQPYAKIKYSVGVDSLAPRTNPRNYYGEVDGGVKKKYALGLMDLSASLLHPDYHTIKGQLRWTITSTKSGWNIVFIPLPFPADIQLYYELKEYAAGENSAVLKSMVKFIRRRMTRPKLAEGADMGAVMYDIAPSGQPAKFRYGWISNDGVLAEKTLERAKTAKTDYRKILDSTKLTSSRRPEKLVTSNEVTIALRQHGGKRFPIITVYDAEEDAFLLTEKSTYFPNGLIPDKWKGTMEARSV